jgi:hypothetical protein
VSSNLLCDKVSVTTAVPRETIEDTSRSSECVILGHEAPNVAVKWLTLMVLIAELPGSNFEPESSYPDRGFEVVLKSSRS